MTSDERQFLLTTVWLFLRHGQSARARNVCEALLEEEPRNGAAAAAMAELLLADGEARRALDVLLAADFPPEKLFADSTAIFFATCFGTLIPLFVAKKFGRLPVLKNFCA